MYVTQLKLLHSRTRGCKGGSTKAKEEVIEDLLMYHPKAKVPRKKGNLTKAKEQHITALREPLRGPSTTSTDIVDHYSDVYGWVDHIDRAYYMNFSAAGHQHWEKLLLFSNLYLMVYDSWAAYCEHLMSLPPDRKGKKKTGVRRPTLPTTAEYMRLIVEEIVKGQQ
jgi:hypothetical protein